MTIVLASMSKEDRKDFMLYLRQCTPNQVRGVYEREMQAGRDAYAELALIEADRRGIDLDFHNFDSDDGRYYA